MKRLAKILREEGILPRRKSASVRMYKSVGVSRRALLSRLPELEGQVVPQREMIKNLSEELRSLRWEEGEENPLGEDQEEFEFDFEYKDGNGWDSPMYAVDSVGMDVSWVRHWETPYTAKLDLRSELFGFDPEDLPRRKRSYYYSWLKDLLGNLESDEDSPKNNMAFSVLRREEPAEVDDAESIVAQIDPQPDNTVEDFSFEADASISGVETTIDFSGNFAKIVVTVRHDVALTSVSGRLLPQEPDYDEGDFEDDGPDYDYPY